MATVLEEHTLEFRGLSDEDTEEGMGLIDDVDDDTEEDDNDDEEITGGKESEGDGIDNEEE